MAARVGEGKEGDSGDPGLGERGTRVKEGKKSVVLSKHSGTLRKQLQSHMKRAANHLIQVKKESQGMGRVDRLSCPV